MLTLIILAASRYDFKTDDGKTQKATKLECVDLNALVKEDDRAGYPTFTMDAPYEVFSTVCDHLTTVGPSIFEVGFVVTRIKNKSGATVPGLKATVAKFVQPLVKKAA